MDRIVEEGVRTALKLHEIGDGTPYRLCFARKEKSGASFGFMQGDLAAGQPEVRQAFHSCLKGAGFDDDQVDMLMRRLGVHCPRSPLDPDEAQRIDEALKTGKDIVDKMDRSILAGVEAQVEKCIAAARDAGRTLMPEAVIAIALWVNMTGAPTQLLKWLRGEETHLAHRLGGAPKIVAGAAMQDYLKATYYYSENPANLPHFLSCVAAGVARMHEIQAG